LILRNNLRWVVSRNFHTYPAKFPYFRARAFGHTSSCCCVEFYYSIPIQLQLLHKVVFLVSDRPQLNILFTSNLALKINACGPKSTMYSWSISNIIMFIFYLRIIVYPNLRKSYLPSLLSLVNALIVRLVIAFNPRL
jgi:hypothetical protein